MVFNEKKNIYNSSPAGIGTQKQSLILLYEIAFQTNLLTSLHYYQLLWF
jgi:hypothetical protein